MLSRIAYDQLIAMIVLAVMAAMAIYIWRRRSFEIRNPLRVWFNGYDWVIARTEADAQSVCEETHGPSPYSDEYDGDGWAPWPDERPITIVFDDSARRPRTLPAQAWVARQGRGFLCSTEY